MNKIPPLHTLTNEELLFLSRYIKQERIRRKNIKIDFQLEEILITTPDISAYLEDITNYFREYGFCLVKQLSVDQIRIKCQNHQDYANIIGSKRKKIKSDLIRNVIK